MEHFEFKEDDNDMGDMDYLKNLGEKINTEEHAEKKTTTTENSLPLLIELLPDLLQEMHKKGIPFNVDGITGNITVDGFYKNGSMILKMDENYSFEAVDKRNRTTPIRSIEDLVKLNFDWWRRSAGKTGNFANPAKPWLDEFQQRGLVKRQYIIVPLGDSFDSDED